MISNCSDLNLNALRQRLAAQQLEQRSLTKLFVEACRLGDETGLNKLLSDPAFEFGVAKRAFAAVSKLPLVPYRTRRFVRELHFRNGDDLRAMVGDDLILSDAYRILMPPYTGQQVTLYRGEGFLNRKHRTYGLPWTADREIADGFAQGFAGHYVGGTLLLRTLAEPEAILTKLPRRFGEQEYLVDRRKLGRVEVIARYPQVMTSVGTEEADP